MSAWLLTGLIPGGLRITTAAALLGSSFAAERYIYHGWCVIPSDGEFLRFFILPTVFALAFVWLAAELVTFLLSHFFVPRFASLPVGMIVGMVLYAAVVWWFWGINPTPEDAQDEAADRALLSVFWSAGILNETGNFSPVSCGY